MKKDSCLIAFQATALVHSSTPPLSARAVTRPRPVSEQIAPLQPSALACVQVASSLARRMTMEPMKPMKPMDPGPAWWPDDLGQPSSSGSQNDVRYAFFPDKRRLAVERNGNLSVYNSGDYQISGVSQQQRHRHDLAFSSQKGEIRAEDLKKIG
jgi:hypothetical protein